MTRLTEAQRLAYRDYPAYAEGFYDAQDGTPIFEDAPKPYRAGWESYWFCRELLEGAVMKSWHITEAGRLALSEKAGG